MYVSDAGDNKFCKFHDVFEYFEISKLHPILKGGADGIFVKNIFSE